jgi:hypothetical protein
MKWNLPILMLAAAALAGATASSAPAAKAPSCTRGGATTLVASSEVRVVKLKMKLQSKHETRREHILACWIKTGARITVAREVDNGLDNIARTRVEINGGRFVGVRAHNEGGVSESITARVYDAKTRKLLHTSEACEKVDQGEFGGVTDVAFTDAGGMAIVCNQLLLYRKAGSTAETLEPAGTFVRNIGVSEHSHNFGQRLFWTTGTDTETTKSAAL